MIKAFGHLREGPYLQFKNRLKHLSHSLCGDSCRYPSLEDIKGRGIDKALWKLVPQTNSRREECRSVCVCPAVRDHESVLVTSSYCCALWVQVLFWRNVNQ